MTPDPAVARLARELAAPGRSRPEDLLAVLALPLDDSDVEVVRAV